MSGRPRIAVVSPQYPPQVGGVENYVANLVQVLVASGRYEPVVVATSESRRTTREVRDGVLVVRLGTWARVSNTPVNPLWPVQLRSLFRRLGVSAVWAHSPLPLLADCAAIAAAGRPLAVTYHAGTLVKGASRVDPLLRAYECHVLPRVFDRAQELVSVSPVATSHRTGRDELVPPGVDGAAFRPGRGPRRSTLLYVGRVERSSRWKGLDVLIDALPQVAARVPEVRLDVVGDGDDREVLARRAERLGVGQRVTWHGSVSHAETLEHYQRCGTLVLPSLTEAESFGMVLVEAMACATPVVASRIGGPEYVVQHGTDGLLVEPGDVRALADSCSAVLTDPALASSLGAAGRAAVEARWERRHTDARLLGVADRLTA